MTPAEWNVMDLLFPVVVPPIEELRQEAAELMMETSFKVEANEVQKLVARSNSFDRQTFCSQQDDCPCKRAVCTYPKCEANGALD